METYLKQKIFDQINKDVVYEFERFFERYSATRIKALTLACLILLKIHLLEIAYTSEKENYVLSSSRRTALFKIRGEPREETRR